MSTAVVASTGTARRAVVQTGPSWMAIGVRGEQPGDQRDVRLRERERHEDRQHKTAKCGTAGAILGIEQRA